MKLKLALAVVVGSAFLANFAHAEQCVQKYENGKKVGQNCSVETTRESVEASTEKTKAKGKKPRAAKERAHFAAEKKAATKQAEDATDERDPYGD